MEKTGLPLPLGANAIRKDLGEKAMHEVARLRSHHGVSDRRRVILKPPPEPEQLSLLN